MPRLHPLRIIIFIPLIWLNLILLWIFLPSPTIPSSARATHIQSILRSGHTLTAVLEFTQDFLTDGRPNPPPHLFGRHGEGDNLAIDYSLISESAHSSNTISPLTTPSQLLRVGSTTINLTDASLRFTPSVQPFISDAIKVSVRTGDRNHITNLPWFDEADATLVHYAMHGFTDDVWLRFVVRHKGVVEVWKAGHAVNLGRDGKQADQAEGLLIKVDGLGSGVGLRVSEVQGRLVSRTFWVRSWLVSILGLSLVIAMALVQGVIVPGLWYVSVGLVPILLGYVVLVVVVWCCIGKPPLLDWARQSWLTRWMCRGKRGSGRRVAVWGPAGLVYQREDDDGSADKTEKEYRRASTGNPFDAFLKAARSRKRSIDLEASNRRWYSDTRI